ncbi:FadR family transcriptional regulator [Paenibacillaceae bacterium]|nr:FadR family transcriptional regulator [Paenibacillaceae bacterium]
MTMNPIDQRPLKSSEWVLGDLKKQLAEGGLAPGDRLPSVVDLAARYQVGRSTIREALSALKAMGLLDIRQGGGTFVKAAPVQQPPHPGADNPESWVNRAESLRHLLEVRRVLETGCASLAAKNRNAHDLEALSAALHSMEQQRNNEAFSEQADVQFHQLIAAATHNPGLGELMESMSQKLHDSMKDMRALWFYAHRQTAERLLQEHRSIYEAIAAGDSAEAAARMELHIAKVEQVLNENGAGN